MMNAALLLTLRALADPTRLKMLAILSRGELCACELPDRVQVSQPAVSQHLAVLSEAGLVQPRADGRKRLYSLTPSGRRCLSVLKRLK